MLRGIIVEDEVLSKNNLELLISQYCPDITITGSFTDADEALRFIDGQEADIAFLDIHLGSRSGLEVARALQHRKCYIVFVTAYDKYAVNAFKLNCIDYIMKPVDIDELLALNHKLAAMHADGSPSGQQLHEMQKDITEVRHLIEKTLSRNRLPIQFSWGLKMVDLAEVLYLQADNNYTYIYFANGEKHLVARTIKKYEELLSALNFFRVHVSYLVNLDNVVEYHLRDAYIVLSTGKSIPVSQRKLPDLKRLTNRLNNEC